MDSYQYHIMTLVICSIQNLGVEVECVHGGCTFLCQPADIGMSRLLTANIGKDCEDWLPVAGIIASMTKPLTRKLFVEWVLKAYNNVSVKAAVHSWKHRTYTWFDCN